MGRMSEQNSTSDSIRSFIVKKFPNSRKKALDDDLRLLESGIIDSLGVLDVVAFLEQTFGMKIQDDELTPENFGSIGQLTIFAEQKRARAEVPAD